MARCQNCGSKNWSERDKECSACGYKEIAGRKMTDEYILVFCSLCGCHFTNEDGRCPQHGHVPQVKKIEVKAGVKPGEK
jgi:hypothetical protein